jgi:hypothetical protein
VGVSTQGHKGTDIREGGEIPILIGLQNRHHAASFRTQAGEKFGGHALPIHDHACDLAMLRVLFIARQECGDSSGKMLVAARGGHKQRMTLLVMQQQERSAA